MPVLSIIIPNYNYGHFSDRFFSSVAAQSVPLADVEIIFVDDGSTDDSLLQARKWAGRISCRDFKIFTPARSGRPGPVRNHGLAQAGGRYLVSVDPDDELKPEFLEKSLAELEGDPAITAVYSDYLEVGPGYDLIRILPDFKPLYLRTQNIIPPAAVYRRELWDAGVRYRDNTAYEDWGYWIQCLMAGARFKRIPAPLYIHHVHDNNFSLRAEKDDGAAKAHIVLNNPGFFHPDVLYWANDHLRRRRHAPSFRRGYIPTPDDLLKVSTLINEL